MMNNKSLHDLDASLAVIETNMKAYHSGVKSAYLPVAVELRKLLCDTQRGKDISLIKRLFRDLHLHPLLGRQENIDEQTTLYIPGRIQLNGKGGGGLSELFDESAPSLALETWLQQKLFNKTITIREFIRSVADKEAAHSDENYNSSLSITKPVMIPDDTLAAKTILIIGRYVIKVLAIQLIIKNVSAIAEYVASEFSNKGRGIVVLNLSEFAAHFSNGIPIKYEPSSTINTYFERDAKYHAAAMQIIRGYNPSKEFIVLMIDLDGGIWLLQQAIHGKT
ncbi:MAG: hypothetical protein U0Z26_18330 [Anaerolineales bacterium]